MENKVNASWLIKLRSVAVTGQLITIIVVWQFMSITVPVVPLTLVSHRTDVTRGLIWFTSKGEFFEVLRESPFHGPCAAELAARDADVQATWRRLELAEQSLDAARDSARRRVVDRGIVGEHGPVEVPVLAVDGPGVPGEEVVYLEPVTELLEGENVDRSEFRVANQATVGEGQKPARSEPLLLGITKASLTTESFISAASF